MKKDQFQEFKFNEEKVKAFFKRKKNQESHYEQLLGKAFDSFEQAINDLYESDEYSLFLETFKGTSIEIEIKQIISDYEELPDKISDSMADVMYRLEEYVENMEDPQL
jgi:hypothetical protein